MVDVALVFLGAGIGGTLRFLVQLIFNKFFQPFPLGTIVVNILGCFVIGIIAGYIDLKDFSKNWYLFFVPGLLGGFTTFSSFSLETITLFHKDEIILAMSNIIVSVLGGLAFTYLGYRIIKYIVF